MGQKAQQQQAWQLVQGRNAAEIDLDRAGHSATVVGDEIYLLGGRKGSRFYADLLLFNTSTGEWSKPAYQCPYGERANHSATLIGNRICFIGGMSLNNVLGHVFFLDLSTQSWCQATVIGPTQLLERCAHAAEVHPHMPHSILIMGGYAGTTQGFFDMSNDLLLFHTDRLQVERIQSFSGVPPSPRGYHSMSIVGEKAYIFGGRTEQGVISDASVFSIYDIAANAWVIPCNVSGTPPCPRSSHRTVVFHGRIILYGGVSEARGVKERIGDVFSLVISASGQLIWCECDTPQVCRDMPDGRSAHTMNVVGGALYVLCGYAGNNSKKYARDCWSLQLLPDAYERWKPKTSNADATLAAVLQNATSSSKPAYNGKRPATDNRTSTSPSGKAGNPAAGLRAGHGFSGMDPHQAAAGAEANGWRVAKRQRSGGSAAVPPVSAAAAAVGGSAHGIAGSGGVSGGSHLHQQRSPRQPQLQQSVQQQGQPQPQQIQQRQQVVQQQQRYQQQQQPCSHTLQAAAVAAAMAAAHAANGGVAVGFDMRRPASPSYNAELSYQQQEAEHLREQLQQQLSKTSCLEGENRQLLAQVRELKADKLAAEQQVQQLQGDSLRQKLAQEQAVREKLRADEDLAVMQQQLDAAKQQRSKAETERDQVIAEKQSHYKEAQRLNALREELERDRRQLQQQLNEQQEKQRAAEEKHLRDQQLQQQAIIDMHAIVEQTKVELKRMNDSFLEEQRKHDAAITQLKAESTGMQLQVQEKTRRAAELAQQLDAVKAHLLEEQRKAENFRGLHQTATQQFEALRQTHAAQTAERARLESELVKFKNDFDRVKTQLDHKTAAANQARALAMQLQQQAAAVMNALG